MYGRVNYSFGAVCMGRHMHTAASCDDLSKGVLAGSTHAGWLKPAAASTGTGMCQHPPTAEAGRTGRKDKSLFLVSQLG